MFSKVKSKPLHSAISLFAALIVFSLPSMAKELTYSYGAKNYTVKIDKNLLHLKTVDIDLKFTPRPCFKEDFQKLYARLDQLDSQVGIHRRPKGDLSLNLDGKNYVVSSQSDFGQRVLGLAQTFIQYKLMEKDACKN